MVIRQPGSPILPQTEFTETTQFPWSEVSQQIIRSKRVYGVVRKLAIQSFYNCNLMSISIMFLNLTSDASFLTTRIKSSRLLESRLELPISHFHTTRSAEPQPSRQLGRRRLERIPQNKFGVVTLWIWGALTLFFCYTIEAFNLAP